MARSFLGEERAYRVVVRSSRTLEGDYASAGRRVAEALAKVPGLALDGGSPKDGLLKATHKRMLGRVDLTVRLVELETGEVDVEIEAVGSGLRADPDALLAAVLSRLT